MQCSQMDYQEEYWILQARIYHSIVKVLVQAKSK